MVARARQPLERFIIELLKLRRLDSVPPELDTTVLSPIEATMQGHPLPAASFRAAGLRQPTPSQPLPQVGPQSIGQFPRFSVDWQKESPQ